MSVCGRVSSFFSGCGQCLTSAAAGVKNGLYYIDDKTFKIAPSIHHIYHSVKQSKPTEAILGSIQLVRGCATQLASAAYIQLLAKGASVTDLLSGATLIQESSIPLAQFLLITGLSCNVILEMASAYKARVLKKADLEDQNNLSIVRIFNQDHLQKIIYLDNPHDDAHIKKIFNRQVYTSCAFATAYGTIIGIFAAGVPPIWGFSATAFTTAAKMARFGIFNKHLKNALDTSHHQKAEMAQFERAPENSLCIDTDIPMDEAPPTTITSPVSTARADSPDQADSPIPDTNDESVVVIFQIPQTMLTPRNTPPPPPMRQSSNDIDPPVLSRPATLHNLNDICQLYEHLDRHG